MELTSKSRHAAPSSVNSPSTAIIKKIAFATDTPAEDLPPLYDVLDPDALNGLVSSLTTDGQVEFRYAGYKVTVQADQAIEVCPIN